MDDIDGQAVDANSLINVILPLDLFKTALFPSEEIFDLLYHHLRTYFVPSATTIPQLTQELLFSICSILRYDATSKISYGRFLPSVLRCLKSWRLLSAGEKLLDETIQNLALGLAGIVDCRVSIDNVKGPRRLRIRWIGADSEYVDFQSQGLPSLESKSTYRSPGEVVQGKANSTPSKHSHVCSDTSVHETAKFRSGCCCCRQPRNNIVSRASSLFAQDAQTNIHAITNTLNVIHDTSQHPIPKSEILPSISRRPNSKNVDENMPPSSAAAQSSGSRKSHRSLSSRISTPASKSRDTLKIMNPKKMALHDRPTSYPKTFSISSNDQTIPLPVSKSQSRIKSSFSHDNTSSSCFQVNTSTLYTTRRSLSSSTSSAKTNAQNLSRKPDPKFLPPTSGVLASSATTNSKAPSQFKAPISPRPSMQPKVNVKQKVVHENRTGARKCSTPTAARVLRSRKDLV